MRGGCDVRDTADVVVDVPPEAEQRPLVKAEVQAAAAQVGLLAAESRTVARHDAMPLVLRYSLLSRIRLSVRRCRRA